jgi:hypothetical protein
MGMQTDVKSGAAAADATTTIFNGRTRCKGLVVTCTVAGGQVVVKDNNTAVLTYEAPLAAGSTNIIIPGEGILCATSLKVTCPEDVTAVVFYG